MGQTVVSSGISVTLALAAKPCRHIPQPLQCFGPPLELQCRVQRTPRERTLNCTLTRPDTAYTPPPRPHHRQPSPAAHVNCVPPALFLVSSRAPHFPVPTSKQKSKAQETTHVHNYHSSGLHEGMTAAAASKPSPPPGLWQWAETKTPGASINPAGRERLKTSNLNSLSLKAHALHTRAPAGRATRAYSVVRVFGLADQHCRCRCRLLLPTVRSVVFAAKLTAVDPEDFEQGSTGLDTPGSERPAQ